MVNINSKVTQFRMNIIAAVDKNFGIGKNNQLPWNLPKEYEHFVSLTTSTNEPGKLNAVIMGRKCWESIPEKFRPLKGRVNIVLSRTMKPEIQGQLIVANHLDQAIQILSNEPFKDKIETIWNVGGHDIYAMGLEHPLMHKMILTRINDDFECDVLFPKVDWDQFEQNDDFKEKESVEEKGITWYVTSYTRKNLC